MIERNRKRQSHKQTERSIHQNLDDKWERETEKKDKQTKRSINQNLDDK
jgi:hypothetical protein